MIHPQEHLWEMLCCAVDKMSVAKVAAAGGAGSVVSLVTSVAPDFAAVNAWTQMIALGAGAVGGVLSVGLICLKGWLELKRHWAAKD